MFVCEEEISKLSKEARCFFARVNTSEMFSVDAFKDIISMHGDLLTKQSYARWMITSS